MILPTLTNSSNLEIRKKKFGGGGVMSTMEKEVNWSLIE